MTNDRCFALQILPEEWQAADCHPLLAASVIVELRQKRPSEHARRPQVLSDFDALGQDKSILNVDPEIPDRVLDLGMAEQNLDRTQISSRAVDHGRFGAPHGVGAVVFPPQSDRGDPFIDEPGILPRAHRMAGTDTAWKHEIIDGATPPQQPCCEARAGVRGNFKLHRSPGLPLNDHRAVADFSSGHEIADLQLNQIAASQLAIDRQVEQGAVSEPLLAIKEESDRPDLLLGKRPLGADGSASIP